MKVLTALQMLCRCVGVQGIHYFLMCGQVNRTEMHECFDKAGNVTRSEAEGICNVVHAEGKELRQAMKEVRGLHFFATVPP